MEFSLNALVAPAGILPRQANDQLLHALIQRRTARATTWVGPGAGDQAAVPVEEGLGSDEEARPAGSRQDTADRGEQGAVGGLKLGMWDLAAQHAKLVA
jgi:hypothetical protein